MNHISLEKSRPRCYENAYAGHILANTRPRKGVHSHYERGGWVNVKAEVDNQLITPTAEEDEKCYYTHEEVHSQ